jgi:hypothetical protein
MSISTTTSSDINNTNALAKKVTLEAIVECMYKKFLSKALFIIEDTYVHFTYINKIDKSNEIVICFEIYTNNTIKVTDDVKDYDSRLEKIISECKDLLYNEIPPYVIDMFISNEFGDFDGEYLEEEEDEKEETEYKSRHTDLYKSLIKKNPGIFDRQIEIFSFGEKHTKPKIIEQRDKIKTFDARLTNSKRVPGMYHLRGTDKIIKKCTEAGSGFSEVITRIVNYIETNNAKKIGIFCTAGHHRSVAVVELLKMHLYEKAKIKHKNIDSK